MARYLYEMSLTPAVFATLLKNPQDRAEAGWAEHNLRHLRVPWPCYSRGTDDSCDGGRGANILQGHANTHRSRGGRGDAKSR